MAKGFLDDYQPVEDRLRLFWQDHPYGRVITELLHHEDGDYIVLASVYFGDETKTSPPTATGLAHDSTSSLPNQMKDSALEVCETSAIGRALANAGYAPKDKRPSREEMLKASRSHVEDGEAAPRQEAPAASSTQPPTSPWGSDEQPSTHRGDDGAVTPEAAGEGSTESIDSTPATPEQWARLLGLKSVGGSDVKARNRINAANKTSYTKETVRDATVAEVAKAIVG